MSFDCTCHVDRNGQASEKRLGCIGHIDACGCGKGCPMAEPLDMGRNRAKRERRLARRKGR